jgi:ribosomal protein RSM22 (predicted rRNA methylase)
MKDAIGFRQYSLSNIFIALRDYQTKYFQNLKPNEIAKAIKHQSDYYIKYPLGKTPWSEKTIQIAQIFYYLPLNYFRNLAVAEEILKLYPSLCGKEVIDFGSGLGAASFAIFEKLQPQKILAVETSTQAIEISKAIGSGLEYTSALPAIIPSDTIGWFSYSLTEITNPIPLLQGFDHLVIVEPSTQKDSQKLIEIRESLLKSGYEILAPCSHQSKCPLLGNRSDWCHDKIYLELSEEMLEVEKFLDWENSDLTFSYLVASRKIKSATSGKIRMIGDAQFEKGKTRQMICRGTEREFFSWLDRDKSYSKIARGALVDPPANFEHKSNEIRIKNSK